MNDEINIIKKTVQEIVGEDLSKVILFGSRSRGDFNQDSDYDLLILTKHEHNRTEFSKQRLAIHKQLVQKLLQPFDILIKPEPEFNRFAAIKGTLMFDVMKEGIVL